VCLPALLLGTALGITLARFVPQSAFRKLTLVLVLLMGLLAAYSGLREIIPGVALW
jgi:uncharacterized membrane protein YfcA